MPTRSKSDCLPGSHTAYRRKNGNNRHNIFTNLSLIDISGMRGEKSHCYLEALILTR